MPAPTRLAVGKDYAVSLEEAPERQATILAIRDKPLPPAPTPTSPRRSSNPPAPAPVAPSREVFVHFAETDSRLDRWIDEAAITRSWLQHEEGDVDAEPLKPTLLAAGDRKRKRDSVSPAPGRKPAEPVVPVRRIDVVQFGVYEIRLEEVAGTSSAHGLQLSSLHSQTRITSAPPSRAGPSSRKVTPLASPAVTPAAPLPDPIAPPPVVVELPVPPQTEARQTRSSPRQQLVDEPSAKAKGKQRAVEPEPPFVVAIDEPEPAPVAAALMLPALSADVSLISDSAASSPLSSAAASPELDTGAFVPPTPDQTNGVAPSSKSSVTGRGKKGRFTSGSGPAGSSSKSKKRRAEKRPRTDADREKDRIRSQQRRQAAQQQQQQQAALPPSRLATPDPGGDRVSTRSSRGLPPNSVPANAGVVALPTDRGPTTDLALVPATGLSQLIGGKLHVCDRCFKYMVHSEAYVAHRRQCTIATPPGRKVYQRGARTIWEVDGASAKLWCQNLALFGKHKYVFFDVDGFLFYVLTDGQPSRDHVLGFFSKEKFSYDGYNLACIVILPPYQSEGYGKLLIEFSYELDRRKRAEGTAAGTPERPLSDLGLAGYVSFWTGAILRHFDRLLSAELAASSSSPGGGDEVMVDAEASGSRRGSRRHKGYEGELPIAPTSARSAKSATTAFAAPIDVEVRFTLADLAQAVNLRADDVAFTLEQVGFGSARIEDEDEPGEEVVVISRAMVDSVKARYPRRVLPALLSVAHVLL